MSKGTPNLKVVKGGAVKGENNVVPEVQPIDHIPVDRHSILEVHSYVDDKGREVNEFCQVFGKNKDTNFYKGRAVVQVRGTGPGGAQMPPRHQSFEFDIEATGLKKAFELFDETAEAELSRIREQQILEQQKHQEAQKNAALDAGRIAVPGGGQSKGIVGPSGRPVI